MNFCELHELLRDEVRLSGSDVPGLSIVASPEYLGTMPLKLNYVLIAAYETNERRNGCLGRRRVSRSPICGILFSSNLWPNCTE